MGVLIEIPSALKQYVNNQDEVEVDGSSVEEAFDSLCTQFTRYPDPDIVAINLQVRLKQGSTWEAYGPEWKMMYDKVGDIGNLDNKIQQIIDTLNTNYRDKIHTLTNDIYTMYKLIRIKKEKNIKDCPFIMRPLLYKLHKKYTSM